ncbi:MAG: sulfatase-like hydrolase/transferase [Rikenellaceae bacterium]
MKVQNPTLISIGAAAFLGSSSMGFAAEGKATKKVATIDKPNVIFIYGDDMGKGMMSVYGQKYLSTPNLDRITNQGIQFTRAYGAHYSAPARSSLLTGYSDCHVGHWKQEKGARYCIADTTLIAPIEAELNARDVRLKEGDEYLPQVFKKAGYVTGQIGKLEYGFLSSRQQVKSHGWDYFYGFMDHGRCHGFFPPFLFENDDIVMIDGNTDPLCGDAGYNYDNEESYRKRLDMTGKVQYSQDLFNAKIKDFLHEHKDEPFFLYHPSQLPHGSVCVPYIHESVKYMPNLTPVEKEYATMILLLDEAVGKILDELDVLGIADKTMIVFSVDNGHEIYTASDGRTTDATDVKTGQAIDNYYVRFTTETVGDIFNGNMGMSGRKRSNLEGGVCVPLTYYMPSRLKPGVSDQVIANYDMIATMAEMLEVDICEDKEAQSYYSLLLDSRNKLPENRYVLVDSYEGPSLMMNDGWKLRYSNVIGSYELFDIRNDYKESKDLAKMFPDRVAEMKAILEANVHTSIGYKLNKYVVKDGSKAPSKKAK